ncbi:MAG: replication protein [Candidatus Binatota bacterium]
MPKTGNPQLEHGHTRIANELLEALIGYPFGGGELKVLLTVIRLTYGWNRKRCPLKQTALARLTRLDRRQVQRVLTALRQQGVLFRDRTTRPFTYQLNKAYQGWRDWPIDDLPDNVVRFMEVANQGSMPGCELSAEPDKIAAAAPDTCVRSVKEIKKEKKERAIDPAVHNLLASFS